MTSIPSTGSEARSAVAGPARPQFAAWALALIGAALGTLLVGAVTRDWTAALALVAVALLLMVLDLVRAFSGGRGLGRVPRGVVVVLAFDVFALGILAGAWAAAGAGAGAAGVIGGLGLAAAALGYGFRRQVLAAFMAPRSSPLGIVLALVPALGGATTGVVLGRAYAGSIVPAAVMLVGALYLLLFAQAALLRMQAPGWHPPTGRRPRRRPRSETRSRTR